MFTETQISIGLDHGLAHHETAHQYVNEAISGRYIVYGTRTCTHETIVCLLPIGLHIVSRTLFH